MLVALCSERSSPRELTRSIANGELTPTELVRQCLDRVPEVLAWVRVERDTPLADAARLDGSPPAGQLHGLPAGIIPNARTGCSRLRNGMNRHRRADR